MAHVVRRCFHSSDQRHRAIRVGWQVGHVCLGCPHAVAGCGRWFRSESRGWNLCLENWTVLRRLLLYHVDLKKLRGILFIYVTCNVFRSMRQNQCTAPLCIGLRLVPALSMQSQVGTAHKASNCHLFPWLLSSFFLIANPFLLLSAWKHPPESAN